MRRLVEAHPWELTPLGPRRLWPETLLTAVEVSLASHFPMLILWGDELVQIYNDGYRSAIGAAKHPRALGQRARECWAEMWEEVLEPMFRRVVEAEEAIFQEDRPFFYVREGRLEETFFTFCYSPLYSTGRVAGILVTCIVTTARVLAQRRLAVLREVAALAHSATSASEICEGVIGALRKNPFDVPFGALYLASDNARTLSLVRCLGIDAGTMTSPERISLSGYYEPATLSARVQLAARSGELVRIDADTPGVPLLPGGPWPEPSSAVVAVPLLGLGRELKGLLLAGVAARRPLDAAHEDFLKMLASEISSTLAHCNAYEYQRRRAEDLMALDRAKTDFFSNISHEFRTPITLVLGPVTQILETANTLPAEVTESLRSVRRNAMRLTRMVDGLLDYARIDAGRMAPMLRDVDVARATCDVVSMFRSLIERSGLRLDVQCGAGGLHAMVDPAMWEAIVSNLLSNAYKYTLAGSISVIVRRVQGAFELLVEDTGVGIPPAELNRVSERFYRIQHTRARTHEGCGIGLALVRDLVRLHGGTIEFSSVVDRGTTVVVRLPLSMSAANRWHSEGECVQAPRPRAAEALVEEASRWSLPADVPGHSPGVGSRPAVFVVDDNADLRQYVGRVLAPYYDVYGYADAEALAQALLIRLPQLVILDVMLPGRDGLVALRDIRADPRTAKLPVILLTAQADWSQKSAGFESGANDYLTKPFEPGELLSRMAVQLRLRQLQADVGESAEARAMRLGQLASALDTELARRREIEGLLREREEEARLLTQLLVEAQESERQRLGSELHDTIGQNLSAVSIHLDAIASLAPAPIAERLGSCTRLLAETIGSMREVVSHLRPDMLDDHGLPAALRAYVDTLRTHVDLDFHLQTDPGYTPLPKEHELALYRIAQGAISNVAKHARASQVRIRLNAGEAVTVMELEDDGCGFEMNATTPRDRSWGLAIMRERAEAIGAHLSIESRPSRGTRIQVAVPCPR